MVPVLINHQAELNSLVGKVELSEKGLLVTMVQPLSKGELFDTFGNVAVEFLEIVQGETPYPLISKFIIRSFAVDFRGRDRK